MMEFLSHSAARDGRRKGHYISGYVIMPNHIHALLAFRNTQSQSINAMVGNGKRFRAFELVKRLMNAGREDVLTFLSSYVNTTEKQRGKLHELFEPSFDWRECDSRKFIEQKLDFIHENPCRGNWQLVSQPEDYLHSSALFYGTGKQGCCEIISYMELEDVDLTKRL